MKKLLRNKQWPIVLLALTLHGVVLAQPKVPLEINADYATGVAVGESVGRGLFIRKYFDKNYAQFVGAYSYGEYQPKSNLAFAVGRYFYQETISNIDFPIGLHYFFSMNSEYWHEPDDQLGPKLPAGERTTAYMYPGIGLGIDFFNPGTRGIGSSFSIGYGSRIEFVGDSYQVENLYLGAVFASASLVYNW